MRVSLIALALLTTACAGTPTAGQKAAADDSIPDACRNQSSTGSHIGRIVKDCSAHKNSAGSK